MTHLRKIVDLLEACLDADQVVLADEVALVEEHSVGEGNLGDGGWEVAGVRDGWVRDGWVR